MIMAIALTIEMGFLSLTFAASLKQQKTSVFLVSILLPPLALWLGGFLGATTAAAVDASPAIHVGLISFGIAALLFLVTEELLLEAHEAQEHSAGEEHIWWVDMFFFLGFLMSFLMDKLLSLE
jgi:ZIP family zinc transporter